MMLMDRPQADLKRIIKTNESQSLFEQKWELPHFEFSLAVVCLCVAGFAAWFMADNCANNFDTL